MSEQNTEFEFDESQNSLLVDLSGKMSFVGLLLLYIGGLNVVAGLVVLFLFANIEDSTSSVLTGILLGLVGYWTRRASSYFKAIVDTEGNDMTNLNTALGELRKLYALQYWAMIVALILVVAGTLFRAATM
ncbi:MAG: hypothetical protein ACFHX7_10185 [Pseudomonadota bacterium]